MAIIRRVTRIANPRKTKARRKAVKARRTRKHRITRNPVLLEFGVLNPRKRRISVAKKRRKARRSSNPRRHAVARVHHRRRRNPMGYGSKSLVETSLGALLGVSAVRVLPAMIPSQITSAIPVTPFTGAAINAAITFAAWTVANKFAPKDVANGVAIGGGAIVLSQLWSALGLPAPPGFGISGIGDIVATQGFAVPDRSMRAAIPMVAPVGSGVGSYRRMAR